MSRNVHAILDEASSLGHLQVIEDMLAIGRGYALRIQFFFQSAGQVKKCFPQGQDLTLLSNTTQVYFGVNDQQTAEAVSSRLGEETIVVDSGGTSTGRSHQTSQVGANGSTTVSTNNNYNWQQHGRKLLKPEEVMALSPRTAITFTPGVRPIATTLVRYYEEKDLWNRKRTVSNVQSAFRIFVLAVATLVSASLFAVVATEIAVGETQKPHQQARPDVWVP